MKVEFEGYNFSVDEVIQKIQPHVTEDRWTRIQEVILKRRDELCLVMENIHNRGNTSAVMRSLEAFGYYHLHHIELHNDFKESNRVTQGADKWLVQQKWPSTDSCTQNLRSQGYKIYVTSLEGGRPLHECDFSNPVALCFGNEQDGASQDLLKAADERVFVPMYGFVQSFNISVAAALCLQQIRQHHEKIGPPQLSPEEKSYLVALYLLRSCQNPIAHMKTPFRPQI